MATQKESGKTLDRKAGMLYQVEHTFYDPENGLNLKHREIVQTACVNWVDRMGPCLGEIRQLPNKVKPDDVIQVLDCVEDGGAALGSHVNHASTDPESQLSAGQDPEDEGVEAAPRTFKRGAGKAGGKK